ncbi:ABC transporter substrate-binding protein [Nocardia asteroides]|uniref:ABC transporter substrate-binding protein n=1 Tax=Nocardia asteroides TaxID=1824 RepID=UPI001E31DAF7|nr:ABC transporter substrate-binding protein [Nocardia asteroides]UGT59968.1 ABC transporter substrate-binding protein [Nocardia asteroides]
MRIAVLVAAALLLVGCQLPERSVEGAVRVPHAQGETVLERTPVRVVALGAQWSDAALALGVTPVGQLTDVAGTVPPWRSSAGAATGIDPAKPLGQQVKELRPELILVEGALGSPSTYLELTSIAPTVPALDGAPVGRWRDQVRALGAALREPDEADEVIAAVDRRLDRFAAQAGGVRGRTVAVAWLAGPGQLIVAVDPAAPALELFTRLGMRLPEALAALPGDQGRVLLPVDRLAELNADVLVIGHSPGTGADAAALPGYGELSAVRNGTAVLLDPVELAGLEYPTALSVPYLLNRLEPALQRAAG